MGNIIKNSANGTVVLHATSNTTWVIAGNNSVSEIATRNEVVDSAYIKQVWYGSNPADGGYWTVKRGSDVVAVLDSTSWVDYAGTGFALDLGADQDLTVELSNAGDDEGYIMIEVKKILGYIPTAIDPPGSE